ncbi:MAG TPA: DoxX family membrane protein [Pyrinomonadaceae bacterium]|nr:DoxX family membrane protein [Pyrinomonadaceae bacterium]
MKTHKKILKWILGVGMISAGVNHFINPAFYLKMMPPVLPARLFLVYLSGFFEIALGVLLLIPRFTRLAAWGIVALLIAVFPANIYMAMNTELFPEFSPTALYLRLPFQLVFIAWAFWFTRRETLK